MGATVKDQLRVELLAARAVVSPDVRRADAEALCAHLPTVVGGEDVVAAYAPLRTEPGFPLLLDELPRRCARVLLPVARACDDGMPLPLRWGDFRPATLVGGLFGMLEPPEPWLPPTALGLAKVVLVPALAVDRRGTRLGRGAGFYDRSLGFRDPGAPLVAVVRDDELVDELPVEPHDVPMTHALTPTAGLVALSPGS